MPTAYSDWPADGSAPCWAWVASPAVPTVASPAPAALSDGVPAAWPDEDSSEIWAAEGDPAVPAEEANDSAALSSAAPPRRLEREPSDDGDERREQLP